MLREEFAQRDRRALIKKYAHSSGSEGAACRVLENGADLIERNTWEQLDELCRRNPIFEILEESGNGYASTTKNPSAAYAIRIPFNSRASRPVDHATMLALPREDGQQDQVNRPAATDDRQIEGPYRRVRLNEWNGLPLLERHRLCQIGNGFVSNR